MNKLLAATAVTALALAACTGEATAPTKPAIAPNLAVLSVPVSATSAGYNHIPNPLPPNVPSVGFQATQTSEFGDYVELSGTQRIAGSVTVVMSDWAKHSDYPSMSAAGFQHPITLTIYNEKDSAVPALGAAIMTVRQTFTIPWRPEADPTCADPTQWRASDNLCYNGFAFTITFANLNLQLKTLPTDIIVGIAYNTNTWGYSPLGVAGPYESLNVGAVSGSPSVGTDLYPNAVFWNTATATNYADGGADGVGTFRFDTGWTGYAPAFSISTFSVATKTSNCKNNGWRTLLKTDGTTFKNQGDCTNYVATL